MAIGDLIPVSRAYPNLVAEYEVAEHASVESGNFVIFDSDGKVHGLHLPEYYNCAETELEVSSSASNYTGEWTAYAPNKAIGCFLSSPNPDGVMNRLFGFRTVDLSDPSNPSFGPHMPSAQDTYDIQYIHCFEADPNAGRIAILGEYDDDDDTWLNLYTFSWDVAGNTVEFIARKSSLLNSDRSSCEGQDCVWLTNSLLLISYRDRSSTVRIQAWDVNVGAHTMSMRAEWVTDEDTAHIARINNTRALVVRDTHTTAGTTRGLVITVGASSISTGTQTNIIASDDIEDSILTQLAAAKYLLVYRDLTNTGWRAAVITVDGTSVSAGPPTVISSSSYSAYPFMWIAADGTKQVAVSTDTTGYVYYVFANAAYELIAAPTQVTGTNPRWAVLDGANPVFFGGSYVKVNKLPLLSPYYSTVQSQRWAGIALTSGSAGQMVRIQLEGIVTFPDGKLTGAPGSSQTQRNIMGGSTPTAVVGKILTNNSLIITNSIFTR